jgi:enterochelin esterase family protein
LVVDDLVPMIDANFRTLADGRNRAIAGLSMGAGQACQIGLTHLDMFASIGSFSGVLRDFDVRTSFGGAFKDAAAFNAKVRLLWFGAGRREERFHTASREAAEALAKAGIKTIFFETPFGHEWQAWRYDLLDFAPRLFR